VFVLGSRAGLVTSVVLDMQFCRLGCMMGGVGYVSMGRMRVVGSFFVIPRFMVFRCLFVMIRCAFVMFGSTVMMIGYFFRHLFLLRVKNDMRAG
jgi:hypothetical protein